MNGQIVSAATSLASKRAARRCAILEAAIEARWRASMLADLTREQSVRALEGARRAEEMAARCRARQAERNDS